MAHTRANAYSHTVTQSHSHAATRPRSYTATTHTMEQMPGPIMRTFSVLLLVVALFGSSSAVSPRPAVKRFAQGVQPKTLLHAAAPAPAPADSLAPSAGPSAASVHTPLLHHVHVPRILLPCPSAAAAACSACCRVWPSNSWSKLLTCRACLAFV